MTDWLQRQHQKRCGDKAAYRTAELADKKAERVSRKTGELIISYQCIDCGRWHIGHADQTQHEIRHAPSKLICVECGQPMSTERLLDMQRNGIALVTCSARCSRRRARRGQRARRRVRTMAPPVSEGGIPGPS
jgi:DNA-directed RNA polymerase subunit RPC12/RpoP